MEKKIAALRAAFLVTSTARVMGVQKASLADDFGELVYVSLAPQAKILMILQSGMRFSKGKSVIWRSDFSKISRPIFQEMLSLKVNSISTYFSGSALAKGKLDICESADSLGNDSLGDAKIFFNFGCP